MFLGLRDLWVAKGRFALVGAVIALVAVLATVLSGLATGLVDDGISGLRALPVTHIAFQDGAESSFSRSTLTTAELDRFAETPGVEATPMGVSFLNATSEDGGTIDIALFGVDPGGFLATESAASTATSPSGGGVDGGLVLSQELADEVEPGERFTVPGADVALPVVGFTFSGTYGHVPIAFTSLATWQQIHYGDDAHGRFSAIALQVGDGVDLASLDEVAGTATGTKEAAYAGSPGYSGETQTMTLIRGFLLVISALVVGAFFTVWTVQRTRQIGLLKALGASNWYVARDSLGQLAVVLGLSVLAGTLVGLGLGSLVGEDVPFSFAAGSVATSAVMLAVAGMAGSLVALRRLTGIDPAISLAAEQ